MANLPLAFAEVLVGAIVLDAGVKGDSLSNVVLGKATQHPLVDQGSSTGGSTSPSTGGGSTPFGPGATSSRLDQGQDVTSTSFHAPVSGKITLADQTNSGWGGGGAIVMTLDTPIRLIDGTLVHALYWTENIAPTVHVGQHVNAGDQIGAAGNQGSYGQGPGSIEWGPAVPNSNAQPLAQAVSDGAGLIRGWYKWALSVGAPSASQVSNAGSR